MPTLSGIQASDLIPDLAPTFKDLRDAFGGTYAQRKEKERLLQKEKLKEVDTEDALSLIESKDKVEQEKGLARIAVLQGSDVSNAIRQSLERGDAREVAGINKIALQGLQDATILEETKDPVQRARLINQFADRDATAGKPLDRWVKLSNMTPEEQEVEIKRQRIVSTDAKNLFSQAENKATAEAKLNESFALAEGAKQFQRNPVTGKTEKIAENPKTREIFAKPSAKDFTPESVAKFAETEKPGDLVPVVKQNSQITAALLPLILGGVDLEDPAELAKAMGTANMISGALSGDQSKIDQFSGMIAKMAPKKKASGEEKQNYLGKTFNWLKEQGKKLGPKAAQETKDFLMGLFSEGTPERDAVNELLGIDTESPRRDFNEVRKAVPGALVDENGFFYVPDPSIKGRKKYLLDKPKDQGGKRIRAK